MNDEYFDFDSHSTYLGGLLCRMRDFLKAFIIQNISRPLIEDTIVIREKWARDMSCIIVSSIIESLANRPTKNIDDLWNQAEDSLRRFAIEEYMNYPDEGLLDRFPRWKDKFSQLPRYPEVKKSSKFQKNEMLKPHPLQALNEVEHAKDFLSNLSQDVDIIIIENIKKKLRKNFLTFSKLILII